MFQKPKGTEDWYPKEKAVQEAVFDRLRAVAKKYGFQEIESPAFEDIKLLAAKSGEEIKQQIFVLEKKGEEEFGLRFDLTVPAARMFVQKQKELAKPVKWFYLDKMWRYERPQKGRFREFYQFGVEVFGSAEPEADAEVIALLIDSLQEFGLTEKDIGIKLNNRKLLEGILKNAGVKNIEGATAAIDKFRKLTEGEFLKELQAEGLTRQQMDCIQTIVKIKSLDKIPKNYLNDDAKQGVDELKKVTEALESSGKEKFIEIDLSIARGLAYYTGTVFECYDKQGKLRAIAGGGRYDNLIELFGGEQTPATGWAMGDKVLNIFLEEKGLLPKSELGVDYFIASVNDDVRKDVLGIASKLRKKYSVEIDLMGRNLTKQIQYASAIGAKKLIVIGPDELKSKEAKIKDMKTGKEEKVRIEKI